MLLQCRNACEEGIGDRTRMADEMSESNLKCVFGRKFLVKKLFLAAQEAN